MKTAWNNISQRERWMLIVAGVFCMGFFIYLFVFSPLFKAIDDKSQQLKDKQATLVWLQQVRLQHQSSKAPEALSHSRLLAVFAAQLKKVSFQNMPYQLQQTGAGDIQLSFDSVPYNAFVAWLWSESQHYDFSIKQLNIDRTPRPGVVKLSLIIH